MTPTAPRLQRMLFELEGALRAAGVRHAIVGGIAMAAHGRIRATEDIDLLVDALQASQLETALRALGYRGAQAGIATRYVRQPLPDLPGLQEWIDVLLARRDIGRRLIDRANRRTVSWQGMNLPVVDPAGLVLMKCLALAADPARVHDADDVRYLLQSGTLDASALEQELADLGEDVLGAFRAVVAPRVREGHGPREVRL